MSERSLRWVRLLAPGAVLAAVVVLDLINSTETVIGLIVIAPLFAANMVGPAGTAAYALAAVTGAALLGVYNEQYEGSAFSAQLTRLSVVGLGGALAVGASAARIRREARLADVMRVADVAQRVILPEVPPRIGSLRLAAHYESAAREASIGGDLYAAVPTPWGVRLLMGDVRGKGLDAVRLASVILGAFRERAHEREDLAALVADLDAAVRRVAEPEDFVTAVLAQVDGPALTFVLAGHPAPILVRDGRVHALPDAAGRPPLGLGGVADPTTVRLLPRDRLLLFTDGMTEARRPSDRAFFPAQERVGPTLGSGTLADGLTELRRTLIDWTDSHLGDDVALLAVEIPGRP